MIYVFLALAVVLVAWGAVLRVARGAGEREKARARAEVEDAVRRTIGLEVAGDPIGSCAMRGNVHGVDLAIDVGSSRTLPGPSDESCAVTAISGATGLPDQIVCRKSDVDKVMGALPAVPRQPAGDPTFDARYAVFVGVEAGAQPAGGYRDGAAQVPALAWTEPKILSDMVAHGLVFMRVRDGRCELAFEPRPAEDVAPLVATAANVIRRAASQPLVTAPSERPVVAPAVSYGAVTGVMYAALGSILIAPIGATLAFLPPLRALDAEAECGKGGEILVSSSSDGDGTSYGLYCSTDHDASLAGHYAASLALYFAVVFALATGIGILRWPSK